MYIGQELTTHQQFLREWFYTSASIGTLTFASLYVVLWSVLVAVVSVLNARSRRRRLEEDDPSFGLDLDQDIHFEDWEDAVPEEEESDEPIETDRGVRERDDDSSEWEDLPTPLTTSSQCAADEQTEELH